MNESGNGVPSTERGSFSHTPRRVLFVITKAERGGAYTFLSQLLSHIDQTRFEAHLATGPEGEPDLTQTLPPTIHRYSLLHLVRDTNIFKDLRAIQELRQLIRRVQPDVLFLNSSKAGFVGSLAARLIRSEFPNLRVIYRIGGWTFRDPWPSWKQAFYKLLERRSATWKDVIVVNSAVDLRAAQEAGIVPRSSVTLIHNGIDPYSDFLPRAEARQHIVFKNRHLGQTIPEDTIWIGTIANLYPAKSLDTLIQAASLLPEHISTIIIGEGPLRAKLQTQIDQLGLTKRVFLVGQLADAHRYLPALDCFVLASVKEGFPWAVLEAMTAKVPVIATTVGAVPEVIEDGVSGLLVAPQDPQQMALAITRLLENERLQQEFAINAHQTILAKFSLRQMIQQYEDLLN